jgi:putative tricarboxylic transport membrane protein
LGIPGDSVTAILMGALIMKGIVPGPQLFVENKEWVYLIMIGFILINIFMYLQGKLFIKAFVNITKLPTTILIPILTVLCVVGSFAVSNNISDVFIMLIFGLLAYVLMKFKFPITPMVIAIVLGPLVEQNLRRSLIISEGTASIFFTRPISLVFLALSIFIVIYPLFKRLIKTMKA